MPKKTKIIEVEVDEEEEVLKPVVCGHEEVRTDGDVKIFKCGGHGEHTLSDCQTLCVKD